MPLLRRLLGGVYPASAIRLGALRLIKIPVSWRGTLAVVVWREHRRASTISYGRTRYEKLRDWVLGALRPR